MPVDRSQLPPLGPEPTFRFPDVRRRRTASGLEVCTVEHHEVPLVSVLVLLPVGAAADPVDRPGLAAVVGDLLDEGSGERDALQVHEALGRIGAQIGTEVGSDATLLELTVLARHADRGTDILAEMLARPRFDSRDLERVRELRLNRLVQLRDMPPSVADRVFTETLYGRHPYAHLPIGTEPSLRAVTLDDVRDFHRRWYVPSAATAIAVGDASHDELGALVENAFRHWQPDGRAGAPLPDVAAIAGLADEPRVGIVHRPGAAQSELRIGHLGLARDTPDYHALLVANMVLGGQFVSRINMNLREHKGYTYGARTSFDFRVGPGPFLLQASVQSEATADAIREAVSELRAIRGEQPVTRQELLLGRAALTRGYPRNFETADQVARAVAQIALYRLPDDYFTTFVPRVLALTEEDVTRAAAAHIHPERLLTVVVGDRTAWGGELGDVGLGEVREIPVA